MPRQGRFSTLVGVATIMGAVFAGISVKTDLRFALDTAVEKVKDQSRLALRGTVGERAGATTLSSGKLVETRDELAALGTGQTQPAASPPIPALTQRKSAPATSKVSRTTRKPVKRRKVARLKRKPKRKTVSVFAAAKDIPYPSKD